MQRDFKAFLRITWQKLSLLGRQLSQSKGHESTPANMANIAVQVEALYQRGAQAFAAKGYREAIQFATAALALDVNLAAVHYLLGSAQLEMHDFVLAEKAFSACLALQPSYPLVQHAQMSWARARVDGDSGQPLKLRDRPAGFHATCCISIIICSINLERFSRVCANYRTLLADVQHEIIGIHDATSLCEGYNRGIQQAKGDFLIFSHDDIEIVTPDFAARLLSYLARYDLIGVAGTTRIVGPAWTHAGWPQIHGQIGFVNRATGQLMMQVYDTRGECTPNAQGMDGVFLAARRAVAQHIGFDQALFDGWHLYDVDFTFSAYLAGYRAAICHDLCVIHDSSGNWGEDWQRYARAFIIKHGNKLPAGGCLYSGEFCSIALESRTQWLLMTQVMAQHLVL